MNPVKKEIFQPLHGGDVQGASAFYGVATDQWLDLSTGINPASYPIPSFPEGVFSRLPYLSEAFISAAKQYYGSDSLLAVAGSQAAIQLLPKILNAYPILLPSVGYKEHENCWRKEGCALSVYDSMCPDLAIETIQKSLMNNPEQHVLIINPNNPTGLCFSVDQIVLWASLLGDSAYIIVDEAFMDLTPNFSVLSVGIPDAIKEKIIVLRSFGKFFGLAGLRLGFVAGPETILAAMSEELGDWAINGPAQYIAQQALNDVEWQRQQRVLIQADYDFTFQVFSGVLGQPCFSEKGKLPAQEVIEVSLFISYRLQKNQAILVFDQLAQKGILSRLIVINDDVMLLRVGLINSRDREQCQRLLSVMDLLGDLFQSNLQSMALG